MKGIKILLAPEWEDAKDIQAVATVEAEYGLKVLKGSIATLAHHSLEYKSNPAPCNNMDVPTITDGIIVISHIDFDTVGGIMHLMGRKPFNPQFWSSVEYIDLNGPHHIWKVQTKHKEMIEAYWAWCFKERAVPKIRELTDVTELVKKHMNAINRIMNGDNRLIENGKRWSQNVNERVESCLRYEDDFIRAFVTENVFCSAGYYSPARKKSVPVTVVFHAGKKEVRIANSDGSVNCEVIAQKIWGTEAGGRASIAGSPRGSLMTESDFYNAINYLNTLNLLKVS
ncbi:hypothetical protein COA01_34755 [Bacillus cereus]|uniref:hypothetical protein n=1 Tax=Bacillus cereus TaxID=1396 RepID=UPI000BFC609E|nr:hypothetical protein [Bacillus cereus]PGP11983.1 hypothetical protein COA01_34755 [Bacillus cereus]